MAATAVSICSNARMMVGATSISAFEEDSTGLCASMWDTVRTAALRLGTWSCARTRALLPATATAPAWGWSYEALLPGDCLRVLAAGYRGETIDYEIENGRILSDEQSLPIRYVYDLTNPGAWDSLLVQAVTFHMGWILAYPITGSKTMQDAMQASFLATITAARGVNSTEGPLDELGDHPLFTARAGGG